MKTNELLTTIEVLTDSGITRQDLSDDEIIDRCSYSDGFACTHRFGDRRPCNFEDGVCRGTPYVDERTGVLPFSL